VLAKVKDI
jgi:alpha-tubulin suppressor-like RCC1 family protein